MKRLVITTLAAFGILLATVPVAWAADATCPPSPLSGTTIDGNLNVTGMCTLGPFETVGGNVSVAAGASLTVVPPVTIGGNILANACNYVTINPNDAVTGTTVTIGGNVQIQNCVGTQPSGYDGEGDTLWIGGNYTCNNNNLACYAVFGSVGGNLQVNGNAPSGAQVVGNNILGNAEVDDNQSGSSVMGNTIGGNLTCTGNTGSFGASNNTVNGQVLPSPGSQC